LAHKDLPQFEEQSAGGPVEIHHLAEIEEGARSFGSILQNQAHHRFQGSEDEASPQLIDPDRVAVLTQ